MTTAADQVGRTERGVVRAMGLLELRRVALRLAVEEELHDLAHLVVLTWNADGTPNFGTPVSLGATLSAPSGE